MNCVYSLLIRSIRGAAGEAFLAICRVHVHPSQPKLSEKVSDIVDQMVHTLTEEGDPLYRKKLDLIYLVSHTVLMLDNPTARTSVILILMESWKDRDPKVRTQSIHLMKMMRESNVPEVVEGLQSGAKGIDILKRVAEHLNNPEYPDKEALQSLLQVNMGI
jgi:hypothetical protein